MAFDELLAQRIRLSLEMYPPETQSLITEKKMFGGMVFLLKGKMTIGVLKEKLMVRVVPEKMTKIFDNPFVEPMDFIKKPMKEFIFVLPPGLESEEMLQHWIILGIEHARRKLTL
ncbi:TfoX/Sxy family protein [Muriicola sp.]|uniref:TfoX/Sxy family protein n=1 Tax=Muriicola sp. TaxID=2020856 RepID=UPI003C722227